MICGFVLWIDAFSAELIRWCIRSVGKIRICTVSVKQVYRKIPMIQLQRWEELIYYDANVCLGSALLSDCKLLNYVG